MSLSRNVLAIIALMLIIWASLLLVSYVAAITILYTLEFPGDTLISIARVILGLLIAGAWVLGWYKLTRLWLYKILLSRRREI
ncbi:MAG: hypothetical protein QXI18_05180 [Nitrososphaerota archaeon]